MKLIFRALVIISLASGLSTKSYAQDLHLSQFDAAPLFFNPALSGNFDGVHRFIGNWKSQWRTYNSILASYDRMLPDKFDVAGGKFGAGIMFSGDRAGETKYGYTQIKLLPSYHIPVIPNDILFLSAGLDMTLTQNGIDQSLIQMGSNIDPNTGLEIKGYDANSGLWYFDLAAGFNAYSLIRGKYPLNVGFTLNHLLKPGRSLVSGGSIKNPRRLSINANTVIPVNDKISFLPSLIWLKQKPSDEVNVGTFCKYATTKTPYAFYVGSWWRIGDAVIVGAAIDFPGIQPNHVVNLGISYDITLSSYKDLSKNDLSKIGNNSFEISLKYIIKKGLFKYVPPVKLNPVIF